MSAAFRLKFAFVCLALFGCAGGDGTKPFANLVPVSGTVSYNGKPLPQGIVAFVPASPGAGTEATGKVVDGTFTMTTTVSSPGVVAGSYGVVVLSDGPDPNSKTMPPDTISLIPRKYTLMATSDLKVEVAKGMRPVVLELKD